MVRSSFHPFFWSFTTNGGFAAIIGAKGRPQISEPFATTEGILEFLYSPNESRDAQHVEVAANKTGHWLEIEDFSRASLDGWPRYLSLDDSIGNLTVLQDVVERGKPL